MSGGISRLYDHISISSLMNYAKKFNIPFQVILATEFCHEVIEQYNSKEEISSVRYKIIFDVAKPYQIEWVQKTLKPVRGIVVCYDNDSVIDCTDKMGRMYLIKTNNYRLNLENFLKIKSSGEELLNIAASSLHQDRYINKLLNKNLNYILHRVNNFKPPRELSLLCQQYENYIDLKSKKYLNESILENPSDFSNNLESILIKEATINALEELNIPYNIDNIK